jgi:hypothetical protein
MMMVMLLLLLLVMVTLLLLVSCRFVTVRRLRASATRTRPST